MNDDVRKVILDEKEQEEQQKKLEGYKEICSVREYRDSITGELKNHVCHVMSLDEKTEIAKEVINLIMNREICIVDAASIAKEVYEAFRANIIDAAKTRILKGIYDKLAPEDKATIDMLASKVKTDNPKSGK